MTIFTIIAFFVLIIAIVSFVFALNGNYPLYWLSAVCIYVFSFIAGFSIGQLTVGLTFVPLVLAIGHSFGWIKSKAHGGFFTGLGVLIGLLMVLYVGNLLFYPLLRLGEIWSLSWIVIFGS